MKVVLGIEVDDNVRKLVEKYVILIKKSWVYGLYYR